MRDEITLLTNNQIDFGSITRDSLKDIRQVCIKGELSEEERIIDFVQQIGNPYCFLCGETMIRISFNDSEISLQDAIFSMLRNSL